MSLERYKPGLKDLIFVFLDISEPELLSATRERLVAAGASASTERTLFFPASSNLEPDSVVDLIRELGAGDCVALVYERSGVGEGSLIVPEKSTAGIRVSPERQG